MFVVFVCTGNVCRSPMAEYMFRAQVGRDRHWDVASAGVAASYGVPASREAVAVLREHGVDLRLHSSRPLTPELVDAADLLVVMTAMHRDIIRDLFPEADEKVVLLRRFDPLAANADLDDPIGMSVDMYRKVREEIARSVPGLIDFVKGFSR